MPSASIGHARRAISVAAPLAVYALVVDNGGRGVGTQAQSTWLIMSCAYVAVPVLALACLCVRSRRVLARVDIATLVTGIVLNLVSFRGTMGRALLSSQTDESLFDRLAARALIAGHNPYLERFHQVADDGRGTPLFSGRSVDRFAYPPLPIELTWLLHHVSSSITSPAFVDVIAVVAMGLVAFFALPTAWRPLVVVVLFGLGLEHEAVIGGGGVVVAAALLCGALYRWTSIGKDGRLGRFGVFQAVLLGLACASFQLAWVVAVFLVVGIVELRRSALGWSRGLAVSGRYVLAAGIAFVAVNLPFIVDNASAWVGALLSVFTQKAIVFGQGWALSFVLLHRGSGGIALMTVATVLLVVVLMLLFVLDLGRLAPGLAVMATLCFALSTRTASEYVWGFWPVWVVGAATIDRDVLRDVTTSRVLDRLRLHDRRRRLGAAVALLLVPFVVFLVGVGTPSPLAVRIAGVQLTQAGRIRAIRLSVRNAGTHPVVATYYVDHRYSVTDQWSAGRGTGRVGARGGRALTLSPFAGRPPTFAGPGLWVVATMPDPEAMTAIPLTIGAGRLHVVGRLSPGANRRAVARCWTGVLNGAAASCTGRHGAAPTVRVLPSRPRRA